MYEDLLFPFDGSDGATEVLHHAAEIADWSMGHSSRFPWLTRLRQESVVQLWFTRPFGKIRQIGFPGAFLNRTAIAWA